MHVSSADMFCPAIACFFTMQRIFFRLFLNMPFSTVGPLFSRLIYGRTARFYRTQCLLGAILLLPLALLFYYAISDKSDYTDSAEVDLTFMESAGSYRKIVTSHKPASRDEILDRLVMSKYIRSHSPIPDTRPNDCIASSSEDSPPSIDQIQAMMPSIKATILLYPDLKHASLADYHLSLASILTTTDAFYEQLTIAIVVTSDLSAEVVNYLDKLKESSMPKIELVKPLKTMKTLFSELVEIAEQVQSDIVVYVASGSETNSGWLEALIQPLVTKRTPPPTTLASDLGARGSEAHDLIKQLRPVIVTPHFDRIRTLDDEEKKYEPETEFVRLIFHWNLRPMWYEMSFEELLHRTSEAEEIGVPAFLPHVFAVNRSAPLYRQMLDYFKKRRNDDTTTFEVSQYIWRCLNGSIVISPCARVGSPNAYLQTEFDPRINHLRDEGMKRRIVHTWFGDFQPIALRLLSNEQGDVVIKGQVSSEEFAPSYCKTFSWYLENIAKEIIIPGGHIAFGWMKSGGGACFRAAIEHRLLGGSCTVLSDSHVFFLEKTGSIKTRTGLCVTAPEAAGYIELAECDSEDPKQHWVYGSDGSLKSVVKEKCIMHATDPDEEKKGRQILMLHACKGAGENEYAAFQKFTFTYKIV